MIQSSETRVAMEMHRVARFARYTSEKLTDVANLMLHSYARYVLPELSDDDISYAMRSMGTSFYTESLAEHIYAIVPFMYKEKWNASEKAIYEKAKVEMAKIQELFVDEVSEIMELVEA